MVVCQTVIASFVRFCIQAKSHQLSQVIGSRRFLGGVFSLAKGLKPRSTVTFSALKLSIALATVERVGQSNSCSAAIVKTIRQLSSA